MVRNFFLAVALTAGLGLTAPGTYLAQELDIAGVYRCDGANPDGTRYRGIVEIANDKHTYRLRWSTRARQITALGIGILHGDVLAVGYSSGEMTGVILYKIEKGPRLTGEWTVMAANGQLYSETLTKLGMEAKGLAPAPSRSFVDSTHGFARSPAAPPAILRASAH